MHKNPDMCISKKSFGGLRIGAIPSETPFGQGLGRERKGFQCSKSTVVSSLLSRKLACITIIQAHYVHGVHRVTERQTDAQRRSALDNCFVRDPHALIPVARLLLLAFSLQLHPRPL